MLSTGTCINTPDSLRAIAQAFEWTDLLRDGTSIHPPPATRQASTYTSLSVTYSPDELERNTRAALIVLTQTYNSGGVIRGPASLHMLIRHDVGQREGLTRATGTGLGQNRMTIDQVSKWAHVCQRE